MKQKLLSVLSNLVCRRPKSVVFFSLVLALASAIYAGIGLKLDTDQDNLISANLPYHQRYKKFLSEFGDSEYFFVVFEAKNSRNNAKKALRRLVEKISARGDLFSEIRYRDENISILSDKGALMLLPPAEFDDITSRLDQWSADLSRIAGLNGYSSLFSFTAEKLDRLTADAQKNEDSLQAGFDLFDEILAHIDDPARIGEMDLTGLLSSIARKKFFQDPEGYTFSRSGELLFLRIMPVKDYSTMDVVGLPLDFLRKQMEIVRLEFPGVPFGLTGRPVLQADEIRSTGSDSLWASLASILGVALLYILYLGNLKKPALIVTSLVFSIAWTAGFITLAIGHLNLLTMIFAIILAGIGVDYGMHFLLRYLKERDDGFKPEEAVKTAMKATASGITTGAVTTSAAFLSALFSDFLGLRELGFAAGCGVLFCLVSQIITLPACLVLWDKKTAPPRRTAMFRFETLNLLLKKPGTMLLAVALLTIASLPLVFKTRFENNILKLQDPGLESVGYEQKIVGDSGLSTWFAAFVTPSRQKAVEIEAKISRLKSVGGTESINSLLPPDEAERKKVLLRLKNKLALPTAIPSAKAVPLATFESSVLAKSLGRLEKSLERIQNLAFEGGRLSAVEKTDGTLSKIRKIKSGLSSPGYADKIRQSEHEFVRLLKQSAESLERHLSPVSTREEDLPPSIKKRYLSPAGNHVVYAYPESDIWQWGFMESFISDLRSVDPHVTGAPIGVYESAIRMKKGFFLVGFLSIICVVFFLLLDFKSAKDTIVAALPLVSGILWLLAWMAFFDIPLSLGNFFALPILIGIGIDSGVHLVHRFRETRDVGDMFKTITPAITLSTLTTLIGFGALSLVRHRGLASFGQIMAIGSLTCLAASLLIVPAVLKKLYAKK